MPLFPLLFFFNDTATTEIYTFPTRRSSDLQLRELLLDRLIPAIDVVDALDLRASLRHEAREHQAGGRTHGGRAHRSEEHTSELQSRLHLVCRLLLETKKNLIQIDWP